MAGFDELDQRFPRSVRVLWRWKWPILAIAICAGLGTYLVASARQAQYRAQATVQINGPGASAAVVVPGVVVPIAPYQVVAATEQLARSSQVGSEIKRTLGGPFALDQLGVSGDANNALVQITATAASARRAAAVANAAAKALVVVRTQRNQGLLATMISTTTAQLAAVPRTQTRQRADLSKVIAREQALSATMPAEQQVASAAEPPGGAFAPRPARDALEAMAIALVLLSLATICLASLDTRVSDSRDLADAVRAPVLGVLPRSALARPLDSDERLDQIRAGVEHAQATAMGRRRPLLVLGAVDGDGRTTTALVLATALARAGERVVLVDADLREHRLTNLFSQLNAPGLTDVAAARIDAREAIQKLPGAGRQSLLPAGRLAGDAADAFGSSALASLLGELAAEAPVIVDTPGILTAPDALQLLRVPSTALYVGRAGRTGMAEASFAADLARAGGASIIGSILIEGRRWPTLRAFGRSRGAGARGGRAAPGSESSRRPVGSALD